MTRTINETAVNQAMDFIRANESAASFARQLLITLYGDKKMAKAAIKIAVCRLHNLPESFPMITDGRPNGVAGKAYANGCRALDRFTAPEKPAMAETATAETATAETATAETATAETATDELSGPFAALHLLSVHFTGHDNESAAFALLDQLRAMI